MHCFLVFCLIGTVKRSPVQKSVGPCYYVTLSARSWVWVKAQIGEKACRASHHLPFLEAVSGAHDQYANGCIVSRNPMYSFQALQLSLAGRRRDAAAGCWRSKVDALRMKLAHGPCPPASSRN